MNPIRVLVIFHQKLVAYFSRKLTYFKPSLTTNRESAHPKNEMLCNMNGGVPKLSLKPIKILCEEQGHFYVMPVESIYKIKPFPSDKYIFDF